MSGFLLLLLFLWFLCVCFFVAFLIQNHINAKRGNINACILRPSTSKENTHTVLALLTAR